MERLIGWESVVVRTADGWIYRFSRLDEASFEREVAVLRAVDGRLGLITPRVERIDKSHRLIAYRTITGHQLDLRRAVQLPRAEREDLVQSLATTLATMHSLDPQLPDGITIPALDSTTPRLTAEATRPQLDATERRLLDRLLSAWDDTALAHPTESPVLLHGDFHPGNMVFAAPTGALTGLWDFSCVERGDPSGDLRYLVADSATLTEEVAQEYHALTGRMIEVEGARIVRVLEQIADAVEESRPIGPELQVVARWTR